MRSKVWARITGLISAAVIAATSMFATGPATTASAATAVHSSSSVKATTTSIKVVSSKLNVRHGANAYVTIKTSPGAWCSIAVYYKSGRSKAAGLTPKRATSAGIVTWTWMVGTRTTPGNWPVYITANGKTIRLTLHVS
ncbi:hypothetical protein [Alicyclobacillus pomorum]|uniref:hypothetical protein n=1 Tax=Alicyclobacillus pomorum TaxID=204470 RepID=UPI00047B67C2|nr:hypothetical protein [Alicyclobacillus pomorum]